LNIFKKNIFDIGDTLKTLKAGNTSEQTSINTALKYLLSIQNADGGWGLSEVEESSVYMTAVVTITLKLFSQTSQLTTSINKAVNYLITKQNSDGGFGSSPSAIHESALVYIALIDNIKDNRVLDNARNYLISMQFKNGFLNDDPNSTVSALRALCFENNKLTGALKPDRYWNDCGMARFRNRQIEVPESDKGGITGQVIDGSTKAPLKDVSVFLESDPEIRATTDLTGTFDLSEILSGNQKIIVTLMEYTPDTVSVNVNSGSMVDIGIVALLPNLAADNKKETATDAIEDQSKIIVTAEPKDNRAIVKTEIPKKDLKRKVSIAMRRRGGYDTVEPEITLANERPLLESQPNTPAFVTTTGTITGSVFDSVTKQAVQGVSVMIAGGPSVNTDEQGMFAVHDIIPDTCQVAIFREGYADQFYQGDLASGETMDMLIYLTPVCMDIDETGETKAISNMETTNPAPSHPPLAVNAGFDAGRLNTSPAERTDAIYVGPEMLIGLDKMLTPSAVVPDGDKQIKVDIRLEGIQVVSNPVVLSAATNRTGDKITVTFDKVMVDPTDKYGQFAVNIDNTQVSVIAVALNKMDNAKIDLTLALPVTDGQIILLSYIAGDVISSDGKKLVSFSDQMVNNKVLPPLYCQDGFGYSGLVAQNPLRDSIFMTGYNQWPSGFYKNVLAFISGVFDGQNIWMVPANADSVIKINKDTGAMSGYNKWPAGFRKGNLAFEGGVFDGQNIWMVPANADSVIKINKDTGVMTEYNNWPSEFKKGGHAFAGGIFDGQNIWMVPSYAESVVKIDKDTGAMTGYNAWPSRFKKGGYAFAGGVFDGQNIWMVPANADSVIKINKDTGVMTEYNNWPSEFKKGGHAFAGGIFDGQNIWMVPYYADRVVLINKDTGEMRWHHQRPSEFNKVEYAFTGGVFDGENIWMIPLNADSIVKINKNTGIETRYNKWPSGFNKGVNAFTGGIFDGENIWMVPSSADKVIKLSSFSSISVSANVTANDTFYFYVSQDESAEGTFIGQGSSWASVYSLNASLIPGVTNYLHIKSTDASGPIAAFIGDFSLNDQNFHFENNTQHLITGEDCWTVYTDAFGGTRGTITTICKNGMGKWSTRFNIDLNAQWIWTNEGKDHTARYFSAPVYYSAVSADPITNVRVIDTIPDANIVIDSNSFTREPYQLSSEAAKTTVEWRFEEITIGQVENLSFDPTLKDPLPGEYRPVSDKLELLYEDVEKRPVRTELGPSHVHVFNTAFASFITTNKRIYKSREDVIIKGMMKSLSKYKRSVDVKIIMENSHGSLVEEIATLSGLTFNEGEEKNLDEICFTTDIDYSGDFRVHLVFYENLKTVGEASTAFTIETPLAASPAPHLFNNETDAYVTMAEKTRQKVTEDVLVDETFANEIAPASKAIETTIIPEKIKEQISNSSIIEVAATLVGTINAQPNPVYQGLAVSISYSVLNEAHSDLQDLTVSIIIINPDTEEIKKTFEAPAKARKGASVAGSFILSTAIFEPRVYTAILQVAQTKKETPKVLASTHFEVRLINVIVT
jgi:hypothetical protein